jgi:hypothetical protein
MKLMVIGTTADRPVNVPGRINWPPLEMYDSTRGEPDLSGTGFEPGEMGEHFGHGSLMTDASPDAKGDLLRLAGC